MTLEVAQGLREGKRLVFTNGVFDILHAGHVSLLEEARKLGDLLLVGVNSDHSVRRLGKGPSRPVFSLEDRIAVLESMRCIDGAIPFSEDTPVELVRALRPEVHVKGGDYQAELLPETPVVESFGGRVVILPLRLGRSTTAALEKLGLA